jgi:hypothetical protein
MSDEDSGARFGDRDIVEIREERRDSMLRQLHRMLLPMLENQLEQLRTTDTAGTLVDWKDLLEAEIQAMEEDRFRLPWEDGLPDAIRSSLEPYRERLEQSYNPMTNPFELSIEQR